MQFEYVITLERQQTAAEARAQARAEARAEVAEARARAQEDAQRIRDDAQQIREEAQRIREEVRQEVEHELRGQQGPEGQGPQGVIGLPPRPPWDQAGIPPQVVDLVTMFVVAIVICIVGLPIARALGRWIDRRGLPSPMSAELAAQMNRIEQAVDTMAVEVERISEAQRFQAKLLTERQSAGA